MIHGVLRWRTLIASTDEKQSTSTLDLDFYSFLIFRVERARSQRAKMTLRDDIRLRFMTGTETAADFFTKKRCTFEKALNICVSFMRSHWTRRSCFVIGERTGQGCSHGIRSSTCD